MKIEPLLGLLPTLALFIGSGMAALWLLSVLIKDVSIVDIAWGLGIVLISWLGWLELETQSLRQTLMLSFVTIWGVRLALHLAKRNIGHGEDFRYQKIRKNVGPTFPFTSLWLIFGFQGLLMLIVSAPVQFVMTTEAATTEPLGVVDCLGIALWCTGMFFETVGDWQLMRFKANPSNQGKVLNTGLWRYTRHPNYFGDFCVWWGIFAFAAQVGGSWTFFGPTAMAYMLMNFSGVPMLEKTLGKRENYRSYIESTSTFFPRPPKKLA